MGQSVKVSAVAVVGVDPSSILIACDILLGRPAGPHLEGVVEILLRRAAPPMGSGRWCLSPSSALSLFLIKVGEQTD